MTGRTHALGGTASLWLLYPLGVLTANPTVGLAAVVAAFAALLPDLDSRLNQLSVLKFAGISPFGLLTRLVTARLEHRGFLHSLTGWAVVTLAVGVPMGLYLGPLTALTFALGYLSHLVLDCCTIMGLRVMWPRRTVYWALPRPLRIVTGSDVEALYTAVLACLTLGLLLSIMG